VHLVNGTGHSGTAYFPPVELRDIRIELARTFQRATAVSSNRALSVTANGRYGAFTLPSLKAYEVVIIE
jgi:hypothetical protein